MHFYGYLKSLYLRFKYKNALVNSRPYFLSLYSSECGDSATDASARAGASVDAASATCLHPALYGQTGHPVSDTAAGGARVRPARLHRGDPAEQSVLLWQGPSACVHREKLSAHGEAQKTDPSPVVWAEEAESAQTCAMCITHDITH